MRKKQQQYSLKTLEKLYTKLINLQPYSNPSTNPHIPQLLNQMGKIIVWGQRQHTAQQNGDIFDFICQVKLFDLLLQIFTKCKNVQTINSIIGFYNMLLTNINKQETLLYLLSHPCILSMVLTKFGTMASELAEYYINFLKGLSRKIDSNTIHIFFNKRYPNFPLLFQTIRFFNHPENLVRTTCRNIILSVFKFCTQRKLMIDKQTQKSISSTIEQQRQKPIQSQSQLLLKKLNCIHDYLTSFPFCIYYIHESNFIREYWKILDMILQPQGGQQSIFENQHYELENLDEIISDHEELLIFLDDLLENDNHNNNQKLSSSSVKMSSVKQDNPQLTYQQMFVSAFSNQCLSQLVMSLCSIKKAFLGIKTSLLVFIFLLHNIHNQLLSNTIIFILFSIYYPKTITHKLLNPVENLLSYNKEWKFKGFWDGHEDKINEHCAKAFYHDKSVKSDVKREQEENQNKRKAGMGLKSQSIFGTQSNYYQREVQKIQKIFGVNILKKSIPQSNYTHSLKSNKSFSQCFKLFINELPNINAGNINLNHFDQNPVASNIYAFLQSKDDTLIMLSLSLLEKVFTIKGIDPELLHFCKLSTKPKNKDFASIITIQRIVINCLKIFNIDPPNLRICTYKQAAKVFLHFVKVYDNQDIQFPKQLIFQAKKGLKTSISRITPYLYGGKQWSKVVEIYLVIMRQNNKFRKNTLRTYGLIPEEIANNSNSKTAKPKFTDELYDTVPRTFEQQIGRDLWIYIILKDLLAQISKNPVISKHLSLKVDLIPSKQNKSSKYEQGKPYNIQKDDHFKALCKEIKEEKYKECDVILLGGYLVIGQDNKVEYKLPYEESYLIADKSDPRKLLVQSGNLTVSLQFDHLKQTLSMKENFTESKNLLLKCHLSSIIKEIQSLENQIK